jgi:hypothetical protein
MHAIIAGNTGPPQGPTEYAKPRLERIGTFRELTQAGGASFSDMWTTDTNDACALNGSSSYTCTNPA